MVISSLKVIRVVAETVTIPASCPWKCSDVVASRPGCGIRKQAMSPKQLMRSRRSVCSPGGCRLPRSTYTRTAAATCTSDRCTFTRARKAMLARYKLWPLQPCVCVCYNSEVGVLSKHLDQSGQRDMVSSFDLLYTPCLRKFDHLQK